ncbi:MAG: hypothetical protein Q9204_004657, partial [Flavoplaca sp. TL-2023a]
MEKLIGVQAKKILETGEHKAKDKRTEAERQQLHNLQQFTLPALPVTSGFHRFRYSDRTDGGPLSRMDMVTAGKHGHQLDLDVSRCKSINSTITFLDSQVNDPAFMLQRSTGNVPVSAEKDRNPSAMEARAQLNSVVTHRGWLVDGTGFGKTTTALLYITQMALYADHTAGHRPTALIVPNGAVFAQWCDTIQTHFKDLVLVISYDTKPAARRYWNHWISASAMHEVRSSWGKDTLSVSFTLQSLLLSQIQSPSSNQLQFSHLVQGSITSIYRASSRINSFAASGTFLLKQQCDQLDTISALISTYTYATCSTKDPY